MLKSKWAMYLNDVEYRHLEAMTVKSTDARYKKELHKAFNYIEMPWEHKKATSAGTPVA